jgi:hypothetical protein
MTDFQEKSRKFFNNLDTYCPREYVLENLSSSVCEKKFINMILDFKNK